MCGCPRLPRRQTEGPHLGLAEEEEDEEEDELAACSSAHTAAARQWRQLPMRAVRGRCRQSAGSSVGPLGPQLRLALDAAGKEVCAVNKRHGQQEVAEHWVVSRRAQEQARAAPRRSAAGAAGADRNLCASPLLPSLLSPQMTCVE